MSAPIGHGWEPSQDCRSDEGVIVGLIDGMIAQARIVAEHLRRRQELSDGVTEALDDLRSDEDLARLLVADRPGPVPAAAPEER